MLEFFLLERVEKILKVLENIGNYKINWSIEVFLDNIE